MLNLFLPHQNRALWIPFFCQSAYNTSYHRYIVCRFDIKESYALVLLHYHLPMDNKGTKERTIYKNKFIFTYEKNLFIEILCLKYEMK